ncbi:toprim domain-containing protein [Calidifontibacillus oryziterrae]|uniref:toprim domain-containing protein n=1 Tax=Calidifontibacillus oryziterrae TaxID=1191699 RepID=UPI0002D9F26B|nr:toprim domain-containing protein [Calidifontibacillus oryziterrae]
MKHTEPQKVIIVEGKSDKNKIAPIISEPIEIICTNGTVSTEKIENIVDEFGLEYKDVYIFADADEAGEKLRKQFQRELPNATHIYIDKVYRQVETTPEYHLALQLLSKNIEVHPIYLEKHKHD